MPGTELVIIEVQGQVEMIIPTPSNPSSSLQRLGMGRLSNKGEKMQPRNRIKIYFLHQILDNIFW